MMFPRQFTWPVLLVASIHGLGPSTHAQFLNGLGMRVYNLHQSAIDSPASFVVDSTPGAVELKNWNGILDMDVFELDPRAAFRASILIRGLKSGSFAPSPNLILFTNSSLRQVWFTNVTFGALSWPGLTRERLAYTPSSVALDVGGLAIASTDFVRIDLNRFVPNGGQPVDPNCSQQTTLTKQFQYFVTGEGMQREIKYPDQAFVWEVTASANEQWTVTRIGTTTERHDIPFAGWDFAFIPSASGKAVLTGTIKPGSATGRLLLEIRGPNGNILASVSAQGSITTETRSIDVVERASYKVSLSGTGSTIGSSASVLVTYPVLQIVTSSEPRKATTSGRGSVNATEGPKTIAASLNLPKATQGGTMGPVTYQVSDDNSHVDTSIQGSTVVAQTSYSESGTKPWKEEEQATVVLGSHEGEKLVGVSSLVAPIGVTVWNGRDDSDDVTTRMDGNRIYARVTIPQVTVNVIEAHGRRIPLEDFSPTQSNNLDSYTTPVSRTFNRGQPVCLSAPSEVGEARFNAWMDRSGNVLSTDHALMLNANVSTNIVLVYRNIVKIIRNQFEGPDFVVAWKSDSGVHYFVEWALSLVPSDEWLKVKEVIADGDTTEWKDQSSRAGLSRGFYRIVRAE